ncbi:MAG: hypothetical protein ACKOFA_03420 [Rhodoluna sp.]
MLIRRALIATVIASLTVLGTTACNMTSPVASLEMYAPSDGSQADLGNLKARNLLYFVDDQGNYGFFGAFANSGKDEITFNLGFTTASGEKVFRQYVAQGYSVVNIGYQNEPPLKVELPVKAGDIVEIVLQSNDGTDYINVPVLDGTLPEYRDLVASLSTN